MVCLNCDKSDFYTNHRLIRQEYKGKLYDVYTDIEICDHCGDDYLTEEQANNLEKVLKKRAGEYEIVETTCDHLDVRPVDQIIHQVYKGKNIIVVTKMDTCVDCAAVFITDEQGTELLKKVKEQYNE